MVNLPRIAEKLASLGWARGGASTQARLDGKAEALFLDSVKAGATWPKFKRPSTSLWPSCPFPKVMTYQLEQGEGDGFQPGWTSVISCAQHMAWWPCMAIRLCRFLPWA